MAGIWTCERGHRWSASHARAGDVVLCPFCGGKAVGNNPPISHPTLLLRPARSSTPQPVRPPDTPTPDNEPTFRPVSAAPKHPHVPGYEILDELGRGGMGVVYCARQLVLDRLVALKMIHTGPNCDAHALARFRGEAEIIAQLQHANIMQVYEIGVCPAGPYLSMELAAGGSLAGRLNGMPLPARTAALVIRTLARAVQAAHDRGVIHRDLKPANILLSEGPEVPLECATLKISDFGLARRLDEHGGLTLSGQVIGTPGYLPPEQAQGKSRAVGPPPTPTPWAYFSTSC
jgi:serine/threonine protein kinase